MCVDLSFGPPNAELPLFRRLEELAETAAAVRDDAAAAAARRGLLDIAVVVEVWVDDDGSLVDAAADAALDRVSVLDLRAGLLGTLGCADGGPEPRLVPSLIMGGMRPGGSERLPMFIKREGVAGRRSGLTFVVVPFDEGPESDGRLDP